jgi:EAL domain-containing protein (putative c-di-GMP-specific phosphodiesterase class I)
MPPPHPSFEASTRPRSKPCGDERCRALHERGQLFVVPVCIGVVTSAGWHTAHSRHYGKHLLEVRRWWGLLPAAIWFARCSPAAASAAYRFGIDDVDMTKTPRSATTGGRGVGDDHATRAVRAIENRAHPLSLPAAALEVEAVHRIEPRLHARAPQPHGALPRRGRASPRLRPAGEARVRWRKPDGRLVLPINFIPVAEETGLIVPLGQWVLDQACAQTRRWQDDFPADPPLGISINLSARHFQHPHLIDDVAHTLTLTGINPGSVKLEVTESVAMHDPEASATILRALKALGLRLAIDDFGTGYSSLGYLQRFPLETLKIDRSFVDGLGRDSHNEAIVQSVIALARALNLTTTAEGIETVHQQARLRALGCDAGQGFLFARPAPSIEIEKLFATTAELPHSA